MNAFEFVLGIVAITTVGQIIRARMAIQNGLPIDRSRGLFGLSLGVTTLGDRDRDQRPGNDDPDTRLLLEEMQALKQRIHTLERIAVDKESTLAREIEQLRDR